MVRWCALLQWLLSLMLNCISHQLLKLPSLSIRTESYPSQELYLAVILRTRYSTDVINWVKTYGRLVYRQDLFYCCRVPTALLCTSSVWHCQQSQVCVISGAMGSSDLLSSPSLQSFWMVLTKSVLKNSLGRWPTMIDAWSFSVLRMVSEQLLWVSKVDVL